MPQNGPEIEFELKTIRADSVLEAVKKAEQYRLLNEPSQAESIVLDVLAVQPENQPALVVLILAMSDRLATSGGSTAAKKILAHCDRLTDEYQRLYYTGIVHEREARGFLEKGMSSVFAYDGLRDAMELFERAEKLHPPQNDDAILRWNSCVRAIQENRLRPRPHERELPLE